MLRWLGCLCQRGVVVINGQGWMGVGAAMM